MRFEAEGTMEEGGKMISQCLLVFASGRAMKTELIDFSGTGELESSVFKL